tara:strand:+ start:549 stop:785 length:237 start_codon:yes stop_codon:yes gene_type:complete
MNSREMKKQLKDFLIRQFAADDPGFSHVKFLHFIDMRSKTVTPATIRRIEAVTRDLLMENTLIDPDEIFNFKLMPGQK